MDKKSPTKREEKKLIADFKAKGKAILALKQVIPDFTPSPRGAFLTDRDLVAKYGFNQLWFGYLGEPDHIHPMIDSVELWWRFKRVQALIESKQAEYDTYLASRKKSSPGRLTYAKQYYREVRRPKLQAEKTQENSENKGIDQCNTQD